MKIMQQFRLFSTGGLVLAGAVLFIATSIGFAQDSSSKDSLPVPAASPTPNAQVHKQKPSPERDAAITRGEQLLFKNHDAKASVEEFRKAVKADPWYGQGYMLLGVAQMQLGQWGDAQWAFEEATKVEPGNAKAYLGIGSALNEQKKYADAQKALEHSLELQPESAEAHYELARTFAATNKWDLAAPHARRAIDLKPEYAGPHALMGNIYVAQEEPEAALKEFEEFLRLDPKSSMAPQVKEMVAELKETVEE